ncbi:AAEL003954-PA [Aedes aegypti]|uniref:AAEL003954-PA n=1 Tax=Aedes aegypti TaxID=7159 RepID=Q17E38_AEDAE|nr:AAEL003954-PA [Aedes aegypti]
MAEHSADELQAPEWLNDQFFTEILQKSEDDPSLRIVGEYKLLPATQAGDHYASIMFRTSIRYETKRLEGEQEIELIIKAQPTADGFKKELSKDNALFVKEIKMYSEILPAMVKVLKEAGEHLEVARLIHAALVPNVVIVMESLTPKGWLPGRESVVSYEEALPTIRNIANFHAASLYLNQEITDLSTNSVKEMLSEGVILTLFTKGFEEFCAVLEKWEGYETIAKKLKTLRSTFKQRLQDVYTPNPKTVGYNVLAHADFSWKNVMHKTNSEGRPVDSMLIDYQCCHWGSPAIDVFSLLDLIIDNRTKTAHRGKILYEYHKQFATVLGKIGFTGKIPTLVDLQIELLRKGFMEVLHETVFEKYKYIQMKDETFDNLEEGNPDDPTYRNQEFCDTIRREMSSLLYKGLLD